MYLTIFCCGGIKSAHFIFSNCAGSAGLQNCNTMAPFDPTIYTFINIYIHLPSVPNVSHLILLEHVAQLNTKTYENSFFF